MIHKQAFSNQKFHFTTNLSSIAQNWQEISLGHPSQQQQQQQPKKKKNSSLRNNEIRNLG